MGQKTKSTVNVPPPTAEEKRLQGVAAELGGEQLRAIQEYSPYREQLFGLLPSLTGRVSRDLGLTPSVPLRGTTPEERAYRDFLKTAPPGVTGAGVDADTFRDGTAFDSKFTERSSTAGDTLGGVTKYFGEKAKKRQRQADAANAAASAEQQRQIDAWRIKAAEYKASADAAAAAAPTYGPNGVSTGGSPSGATGDLALDAYDFGFSPYEESIVNSVASNQYDLGSSDIMAAYRESLGDLAQELAPSRGLRGYDAPILDRGNKLATETVRQRGQLSLGLRAKSGEQLLNLTQQAKQNRIGLLQFLGNQGLGLGTGDALGAANSMQQGRLGNAGRSNATSGLSSGDVGSIASGAGSLITAFSSRALKDVGTKVSGRGILKKLRELKIHRWTYKGDAVPHLGPMAEDFKQLFGVGDGKTLALVDVMGVLLGAMQGIAEEVADGR